MPTPTVTVVIPARGGSKGIHRKNVRTVGGIPLVVRAVDAARRSCATTVLVSSDDDDILGLASAAGATPILRPADLATDEATSESAVLHALDAAGGAPPDITVLLQCTSPFVTAADIDAVVGLVGAGADVAFTACAWHGFLWKRDAGGAVGVNHDAGRRARRQELDEVVLETGGAYAMRTAGLLAAGHRFFGRVDWHVVPRSRALEIDDEDDLLLADALAGDTRSSPSIRPAE